MKVGGEETRRFSGVPPPIFSPLSCCISLCSTLPALHPFACWASSLPMIYTLTPTFLFWLLVLSQTWHSGFFPDQLNSRAKYMDWNTHALPHPQANILNILFIMSFCCGVYWILTNSTDVFSWLFTIWPWAYHSPESQCRGCTRKEK